ncbi:MAG TPA: hypothetical protein VL995_10300 [Cellvibrio sp.]|nr:hypothetical protein [Cellvibrio sp.]
MEKIIGRFVLAVALWFSSSAFAGELEYTYTYGTPSAAPTVDYTMPSGSDVANANNYTSYGGMSPRAAAERAAGEARGRKIGECKAKNDLALKDTKLLQLKEYENNTSTCNNYNILAATSGGVGYITAVPTFGFTAAVASSAAVTFIAAAQICQSNADGAYAEKDIITEYTFKNFDQQVCDKI